MAGKSVHCPAGSNALMFAYICHHIFGPYDGERGKGEYRLMKFRDIIRIKLYITLKFEQFFPHNNLVNI